MTKYKILDPNLDKETAGPGAKKNVMDESVIDNNKYGTKLNESMNIDDSFDQDLSSNVAHENNVNSVTLYNNKRGPKSKR